MNAELELLYENYLDKVDDLEKNRPLGAGIFGMKGGPADDPCHDRFASDVSELLGRLAESGPKPGEVQDALRKIFFEPKKHVNLKTAYWMLLAVHSMTLDLIGLLTREEAEELLREYCKEYPRWERLPVQKKVIDRLEKQSRI